MNYIVILIITTIIFIITAILFYWILNGKDLMVWVEGIRRPKESKKELFAIWRMAICIGPSK